MLPLLAIIESRQSRHVKESSGQGHYGYTDFNASIDRQLQRLDILHASSTCSPLTSGTLAAPTPKPVTAKPPATDLVRFVCLNEELDTALSLLRHGFRALQKIEMGNDFYHLPHQLLASGLERFMKCYICLAHRGRHGTYPSDISKFGHDLSKLLDRILREHFGTGGPLLSSDHKFLSTDPVLRRILHILSHFGKLGRYYNLDVVAGNQQRRIDPKQDWEGLEKSILDPIPYALDLELMHNQYYPRVNGTIIGRLERMIRALARQFTLGGHPDPENNLRKCWGIVSSFGTLTEFGTTDYRISIRSQRASTDIWEWRTQDDIENSIFPTCTVCRDEFEQEWPFRHDRVVVERRYGIFAVLYIDGYAFSLNGAAKSRYRYPSCHETGLAILGKSIGPFIDLAMSLPK